MLDYVHPTAFPSHSSSKNKLGSAGAKELVKGDWPELRVLDIRWDELHAAMQLTAHNN